MTDTPTPLELRQLEDAEIERNRRHSPKFIAFDTLAEQWGQAEWQRFRLKFPLDFLRAKLDVRGGPPGLWLVVDWADEYRSAVKLLFERQAGRQVPRFEWHISTYFAQENDDFLRFSMREVAHTLSRECGTETEILVRPNRIAWHWHEDHKYEQPAERPLPAPPRKRIAGQFCGTCSTRFRTEELHALHHKYWIGEPLPCGHSAAGVWTEDDRT